MGLICSCGVLTTPVTAGSAIYLFDAGGNTAGTATYSVNACADRLPLSTFTLNFVDFNVTRSFDFVSTDITQVTCEEVNGVCAVTVMGSGLVSGETTPRTFTVVFRNNPEPILDVVEVDIQGFAQTALEFSVEPEFTVFGC